MLKRRPQEPLENPEINLTALIDVVFVILIMFILIAPMLDIDRVELAGSAGHKEEKNVVDSNPPIVLHVYADNRVFLNKKQVPVKELSAVLAQSFKEHPKVRPLVYHDKDATFGTYQTVKNAVENAGFSEMDLILKPS